MCKRNVFQLLQIHYLTISQKENTRINVLLQYSTYTYHVIISVDICD